MEICTTSTRFQTLRPRKRGFLHETLNFLFHIDTTLMVAVLPNQKRVNVNLTFGLKPQVGGFKIVTVSKTIHFPS